MLLFIIICAVSINLITGQEVSQDSKVCRKCESKECLDEGKYLSSFMNVSVDPCDNFYEYVCGNFTKNGVIELTEKVNDILTRNKKDIFHELLLQLQQNVQSDDTASIAKISTFFQNCMNETYSGKAETEILKDLIKSLGGWPIVAGPEWNKDEFSLDNSLKLLVDKRYIRTFPFRLAIYKHQNFGDALCIGRRASYFDYKDLNIDLKDSFSQSYYDYILNATVLLGAQNTFQNNTYLKNEILYIMEFEKDFVTKFNVTGCTMDSSIIPIKSLSDELPSIPWLSIFNTILNPTNITVNENDLVAIENWDHISNLTEMIKTTSRRKIANYVGWNIIRSSVKSMHGYLAQVRRKFENSFYGRTEPLSRAEICAKNVLDNFEFGVGAMYIKSHVDEAWTADINRIFINVRIQMKKEIEKIEWMDRKTKDIMQEKLDAISFNLRSTIEKWNNQKVDEYYNELEVYPGTYYSSQLNATLFKLISHFNKHWKNPYPRESYSIFDISTEYLAPVANESGYNRIVLSPAYAGRSMYNWNRPNYLDYAGVGVTLGHEIAHAFDNINRHLDKKGQTLHWPDTNIQMKFAMQFKCLNNQYSEYPIRQGTLSINGRNTSPENFADHAAYKAAYLAYNELINQKKEPCLKVPGFEKYTWQQMYWINVAINKCSIYKPEYLENILDQDEHSPAEARVNIPFSNSEEFARDFNCKVNSNMNPEKKCKVI